MTSRPKVGLKFPSVSCVNPDGDSVTLAQPTGKWHMIVVYRGAHCPRCVTYLRKLAVLLPKFEALGVIVTGVTSDPRDRAREFLFRNKVEVPFVAELSPESMRTLGLYISDPRDAKETDQQFPEPGLFIVNPDGILQTADISNAASFRPDLDVVLDGVDAMINKGMPIRGLADEGL